MKTSEQKLLNSVYRYISIRPRSTQEVRNYLLNKSSDETLVASTIAKLIELHLLDDAEFTSWYLSSRVRSKPRSTKMLQYELRQKGITLTDFPDLPPDEDLAFSALQKKISHWQNLPLLEFKAKSARYLASRGFTWSTIEKVVKKAYNELHVK